MNEFKLCLKPLKNKAVAVATFIGSIIFMRPWTTIVLRSGIVKNKDWIESSSTTKVWRRIIQLKIMTLLLKSANKNEKRPSSAKLIFEKKNCKVLFEPQRVHFYERCYKSRRYIMKLTHEWLRSRFHVIFDLPNCCLFCNLKHCCATTQA